MRTPSQFTIKSVFSPHFALISISFLWYVILWLFKCKWGLHVQLWECNPHHWHVIWCKIFHNDIFSEVVCISNYVGKAKSYEILYWWKKIFSIIMLLIDSSLKNGRNYIEFAYYVHFMFVQLFQWIVIIKL